MNRSRLVADRLYYVQSKESFFYTPDAVGGYWYDNSEEVIEAGFGDLPVHWIEDLTDY